MGFFDKIKQGLQKTNQLLNTDIRDLFKSRGRLVDDAFLEELLASLVRTDMGRKAAASIVEQTRVDFRGRVVEMADVVAVVKQRLLAMLSTPTELIRRAESGPTVVMVAGVNGSGKTTSIAKLSRWFTAEGQRVVLGAADTFRAAAVDQLAIWAGRLGCDLVRGEPGADPASVAHRAVTRAIEQSADVCIVDTAGRLHTQTNLMRELTKIRTVIGKKIPDAPHEVLLVLDATGGQNGVLQAKHFSEAVECTGMILAKLDGTAKGGVVVAIQQEMALPVKFVGVGESADDLAVFDAKSFVDAMFADVS